MMKGNKGRELIHVIVDGYASLTVFATINQQNVYVKVKDVLYTQPKTSKVM